MHNLYLELILAVLYWYPEFSGWTVRDSGKSPLVGSPPFPSLQSQAEHFQWETLKSDFCWSRIFKYLPNDSLPCQRSGIFPEGNLYLRECKVSLPWLLSGYKENENKSLNGNYNSPESSTCQAPGNWSEFPLFFSSKNSRPCSYTSFSRYHFYNFQKLCLNYMLL